MDVNLNEVIQAASYLKPGSYVLMTPGKINRALICMFSKFTVCVKALIVKVRAMYMPAGYDELGDEYAALDLAVLDGHNAQACNNAAMAIVKRYGIRRSDIVLLINDTTNTPLATSRLIVGTDGACNMYLANLACDHAIGKRKRRLSTHSKNVRTCA
ncbi:unnamed protein product [Sphagnum tenellum]